MTTVSFAQFALSTMVMGLYIAGWKMGSNPFILLRDSGVLDNAPALHLNFDVAQPLRPDYLSSIKDGKAKVEMGLARGKKAHDKRAALMEKQANREVDRELARRSSGKSGGSRRSKFED